MASQPRERAAAAADATIERIRSPNERIMESARHGGEAALETYERRHKNRKTVLDALARRR